MRALDGALLLDKPVGISSNAALQAAKRLFRARKAGHAGTLDPLASGLLLVLFGEATKFAGPLLESDKSYVATVRLGVRTATGDAEGEVLERKPVAVSEAAIEAALARFRGPIHQLPPMYSALKRGGVPLYELARRGQSVERQPRRVHIQELVLLARHADRIELRVRCSKGTYVRTLAEDIGGALDTGAHLEGLRRTALGDFDVVAATDPDTLARLSESERDERLLTLPRLLAGLPRTELDAAAEAHFRQGRALPLGALAAGLRAVFRPDGTVIGLGQAAEGVLKPVRLTALPSQTADKARQTCDRVRS
jgi:tRNA pseudouridine55 synthase